MLKTMLFSILGFLFISYSVCISQNDYEKKYIEVTPGAQYEAGWLHELFLGEHWRDLWTTSLNVEILDLHKFTGGLTPIKRGGGFQTKSLRLMGKDGNIWKFRSMAKDPAKVLPKILRKTVVADVFQDQISSANPLAALVAAPILSAVGILQAKPYLVYMPDDAKLGKFREDFGGELGMIEIHPDVDEDEGREFEGADKIKSTFKLFDRLADKRSERVDANSYLKARLVDVFLGDWDRHTDQWKWARYEINDNSFWEPIPRDRDQVFAKWDGIGPRLAEYVVPQFVHFDDEYPDIEDMTWSGRFLDRRFLTEINREVWDSVTTFVVSKLTDDVIENAVRKLPDVHYKIASKELISNLKSRRNLLKDYSKEYYTMINTVVDIFGSDKDDIVEVTRLSDTETKVEVFYFKKKDKLKKKFYNKIFNNENTDDIRIFLMNGDDKTIVSGEVNTGPIIRIIGGGGKDTLIDNSKVNGYLFSVLPIPSYESKTEFYDSGKKTKIVMGPGTYINRDKMPKSKDEFEKYEPSLRNRSVDWLPSPILGFNTNDGIVAGIGAQIYGYNFRMDPYEYWMNLTGEYATRPQSFSFNFNGVFNSIIRGTTITLDIIQSELLFTNYYGFGNETTYDEDLEDDEYYRIDDELFSINSAIHLNYFGNISGSMGIEFKNSKLELNNDELLTTFRNDYGLEGFQIFELFTDFNLDTRDGIYYPQNGYYANVRASLFPKLLDNEETFFKAEAIASYFANLKTFTEFTFGLRAGGGVVLGDYPFFESIFIGGSDDLRGFSRRRFAGDAAIYGQFEVRSYLFPINVIVPDKFGVHGFIESGRVFDEIFENSNKWHPSYGGGFWMSFVDNAISASCSFAQSSETSSLYINLGMGF